jgi:hypothetical protein
MTEVIGNEAMRLESTPLTRMCMIRNGVGVQISPTPNSDGLPCDISHLAGMGSYSEVDADFLQLVKRNVPKTDVEVKVGSTGYIIWPKDFPDNRYTLDEVGRTVGKVDGIRFFQRYTSRAMVVSDGQDGYFGCMPESEEKQIRSYLNNEQPNLKPTKRS